MLEMVGAITVGVLVYALMSYYGYGITDIYKYVVSKLPSKTDTK